MGRETKVEALCSNLRIVWEAESTTFAYTYVDISKTEKKKILRGSTSLLHALNQREREKRDLILFQ